MPATYEPITTTTLGSDQATITFSSISGAYTDIIIIANYGFSSNQNIYMRFNGDSGSNYSRTGLQGNGTSATSGRNSNVTFAYIGYSDGSTTAVDKNFIVHIMNYSNTTTNKTSMARSNASGYVEANVHLWRSTSAITQIELSNFGIGSFKSGSTFTIYGIKAA